MVYGMVYGMVYDIASDTKNLESKHVVAQSFILHSSSLSHFPTFPIILYYYRGSRRSRRT